MERIVRRAEDGGGAVMAALVALVALAALWVARGLRRRQTERLPPGPRGLPVVGNLFQLLNGKLPHRAMAELSQKYGPIVLLRIGFVRTVLISDSTLAKACLTGSNDKIFANRPPLRVFRRIILATSGSGGLATAPYGDEWRHARKLCSLQLFTTQRVAEFELSRRSEIVALVHKLKHRIKMRKSGGADIEHLNLSEAIANLTEAVTWRLLLGKPSMEMEDADVGRTMHVIVQRLSQVSRLPVIGDFIPFLGFLDGKVKAALDEIHETFDICVEKLIRARQQRHQESPTIIDILLRDLDMGRTKAIIMELIVAGIDTQVVTLDWAMAELMANPEAMRKLQEELDKVTQGEGRIIEEAELGKMEYLKAVVKETMRLHAPVPLMIPHLSSEECSVGGYTIPKGSTLLVNAWAIGRDPRSWEEPERFLPERFLSDKGSLIDLRGHHFELLPFGSGLRACPGLRLALPFIQSALANLVHAFDWHLPPTSLSVDLSECFATAVCRANPLYVIPHLRHDT